MSYICSTSLSPEAIYSMAVIQVVSLSYFIFPIVCTAQPGVMGPGGEGAEVDSS